MASKSDDNTPSTVVVGDLTSFTEEQIAKTLANVEVSFKCRFCQIQKTTLQDLIDHMVKGPCMKSGNHGDGDAVTAAALQLKMSPRNYATATTQRVVKPDVEVIHFVDDGKPNTDIHSAQPDALTVTEIVAVKPKAKRGRKKRQICPVDEVVETSCSPTVPLRCHNTRCSTGAIKRININELLASPLKWEVDDQDGGKRKANHSEVDILLSAKQIKTEVCEVVPKRGRGRPRKYPKVEQFEDVTVKEETLCEVTEVEREQSTPTKGRVGRPRKDRSTESSEVCKVEESPKDNSKALVPYQPLWILSTILPEAPQPKSSEPSESITDSIKLDLVKSDPLEEQQVAMTTEGDPTSPVVAAVLESTEDKSEVVHSPVKQSGEKPKRQNAGWKRPRTHRCNICKMRFFATIGELEVHMDCHLDVMKKDGGSASAEKRDLYECFECHYECVGWNRMLIHLVSHRGLRAKLRNTSIVKNIIGVFRCPVCKKAFEKKGNMKGHYRKVHFKHNRICEVCGKTLAGVDEKTFVRHVEKCKNVQIQCEFCDYKTTVTANFRKHYKVHTGDGFTCQICLAVYPTRQRYDVHCRTHAIDRPKSVCEFCGQEFLSEDAVRKHVQRFHVERTVQYGCPQCQYIGKMEIDLRKHISSVHNKRFKCEQCPYQTNSPSAFEQHREYHQPDRIYGCPFNEQCFYRGATTKQLANHVSQVHKVGSKHQCPICLKFYKKKTHLLRHLVSHTKEKPYVCLECEMAFVNHSSYYRHRRKTGHDKKREGIVSVPQNITIQYLGANEGVEVITTESPQGGFTSPTCDAVGDGHQVMLAPSHAAFMQDVANAEEVLRHEQGDPSEQVLLFDSTMFQLTPASMADLTNAITIEPLTEEVETETADGSKEELQCAGGQEVTYILKMGDDDGEYQVCTGTEETIPACEGDSEQLQEVVYKEANTCGVQTTIVEVAAPGGEDSNEHRYAILMCSPGDEPEAALSMLQLQSAVQ